MVMGGGPRNVAFLELKGIAVELKQFVLFYVPLLGSG
jgi:hypothetical protein